MSDKARTFTLFLALSTTLVAISTGESEEYENPLPALAVSEQEAVYRALELINGDVPWRVIFPDDLCVSSPHGVVCDYFFDNTSSSLSQPDSAHITELNFGYVSDYNSNPPCATNATLPFWVFSSLPRLRKLFVFNCFNHQPLAFPDVPVGSGDALEELVLIDNPALTGSLTGIVQSFKNLKKLVVTGSGFTGAIPEEIGNLVRLEQLSLGNNKLNGVVSGTSLTNLTSLKLLDLSRNQFDGPVPETIGDLRGLIKLDLSFNRFTGKIPNQIGRLSELEFLDLSYNRFGRYGLPVGLKEMVKLKEVHLSGNDLGGEIPEIWGELGGLVGLGLSDMNLTGEIPESMAASLRSLSYLGLENNSLEGKVPDGLLWMENLKEINLENNKLSGAIRLRANVTAKRLKLAGNSGLCIDQRALTRDSSIGGFKLGLKACVNDDVSEMPVGANLLHEHASVAQAAPGCCYSSYLLVGFLGITEILSFCL